MTGMCPARPPPRRPRTWHVPQQGFKFIASTKNTVTPGRQLEGLQPVRGHMTGTCRGRAGAPASSAHMQRQRLKFKTARLELSAG